MTDGFADVVESQRKPSIARVYDYLLDGKDNYAVDREIGDHFKRNLPGSVAIAHANRNALIRAVRQITHTGIRQFIDLGSGLPTADNVHQVAQRYQPNAAVVYVDADPIVLAHGRALLADNRSTTVIQADVREPESIRQHPDTQRLIDFDQPVGVILSAILHHLNDDEDPIGVVRYWAEQIPAGSHVFISHFRSGHNPETEAAQTKLLDTFGRGRWRTDEEIRAFFGDLELLEPGIVPASLWRPDAPAPSVGPVGPVGPVDQAEREPNVWEQLIAAGLAKKP